MKKILNYTNPLTTRIRRKTTIIMKTIFSTTLCTLLLITVISSCSMNDPDLPDNGNPDIVTGETGTFTDDRDNNIYKWVTIGDQTWMSENLNFTVVNGSQTNVTDFLTWFDLDNDSYDAWCYYDNNSNNETGGALYQHNAALNAAPAGWHLPTREEWEQLETYLISKGYSYDGVLGNDGIGKALASGSDWDTSDIIGSVGADDFINYKNITGFTALPAGYRTSQDFIDKGHGANWWTATTHNTVVDAAYTKRINTGHIGLNGDLISKRNGLSVRCIRD